MFKILPLYYECRTLNVKKYSDILASRPSVVLFNTRYRSANNLVMLRCKQCNVRLKYGWFVNYESYSA